MQQVKSDEELSDEGLSDEELARGLQRLERLAVLSDTKFRIPFTNIRFGLDPVVGLLPLVGDLIGFIISGYLLVEAKRLGVPKSLLLAMIRNMLIDVVFGLIPIIGDVADVAFRANIRNMNLVKGYLLDEQEKRRSASNEEDGFAPWSLFILFGVVCLLSVLVFNLFYQ